MDYIFNQVQHIVVSNNNVSQRLDNFLFVRLKGVPKSHVYHIIRTGQVRINSARAKPKQKLVVGDILRIPPVKKLKQENFNPKPQLLTALQHATLYEDDYFIAINKPCGMATHGGSGISVGVIEALRKLYNPNLQLVHRLDKQTSGCLLVAKKTSFVRYFHQMLRDKQITKIYQAGVLGTWKKHINLIENCLLKTTTSSGERIVKVASPEVVGAKFSKTTFDVQQRYDNACLLKIKPITGRTHQIRVHAAYAGCPIAGDDKYGNYLVNKALSQQGLLIAIK